MPITDEIIAYINDKSISRKGKMHTLAIPHFERGFNHTYIEDDVDDLDTIGPDQSIVTHNDVPVILRNPAPMAAPDTPTRQSWDFVIPAL